MSSGKSTFIRENGLEQYALSADAIRLMFQSPVTQIDGSQAISQRNDGKVWDFLFELLRQRMERGEFTIVDATHAKVSMISRYKKLCEEFRYRIYVVDFFKGISLQECLSRNQTRGFRAVPPEAIENAYARYNTQATPNYCVTILPQDYQATFGELKPLDFSQYRAIHHFGDIHGCYEPVREYFDRYPYNDQDCYIFTGDYFDRGVQNAEVFWFLQELMQYKNVYWLEGNHDQKLWAWATGKDTRGYDFSKTAKQFETSGITQADVRNFYRRLGQMSWYNYHGDLVFVNHGGHPNLPSHYTPTSEYIYGVGKYEDAETVENAFTKIVLNFGAPNAFQIHGHRNNELKPIMNGRCFNLCDKVEFGGSLRVLRLDADGFHEVLIKNDAYDKALQDRFAPVVLTDSNIPTVQELRADKSIRESKQFGNVSSFNFTRQAFDQKDWRPNTTRARGLFINTNTGEVVARSYNKFFAVGENRATELGELTKSLVFPLRAYVKENGFLGITGYDSESDTFITATKSTINGEYAGWFRDLLFASVYEDTVARLVKDLNVSFVFEVIAPLRDPHIIEYATNHVVLLDAIKRDFSGNKLPYTSDGECLFDYAELFGVAPKTLAYTFEDWPQFREWYEVIDTDMAYKFNGQHIEGFVFEDANGFMFRSKTKWYRFWKQMRGVAQSLARGHQVNTSQFITPLHNQVYAFMRDLGRESLGELSIIQIRNKFEGAK